MVKAAHPSVGWQTGDALVGPLGGQWLPSEPQRSGEPGSWPVDRRCLLGAVPAAVVLATAGCGSGSSHAISLDAEQLSTVRKLCELLIPRTDTPGAVDAGCVDFVAKSIMSAAVDERQRLISGIARLGAVLNMARGWREVASAAEREGGDLAVVLKKLRNWILLGYYTSEPGATKELRYELVPGRFDPDVRVTASTRSYSSDWVGVGMGSRR